MADSFGVGVCSFGVGIEWEDIPIFLFASNTSWSRPHQQVLGTNTNSRIQYQMKWPSRLARETNRKIFIFVGRGRQVGSKVWPSCSWDVGRGSWEARFGQVGSWDVGRGRPLALKTNIFPKYARLQHQMDARHRRKRFASWKLGRKVWASWSLRRW